jgi:multicomponent Na+:H+ antiporter subunit F
MEMLQTAQDYLLQAVLVVLALALLFTLIRSILGPKFTDRIVAINMIGTQTISVICLLAIAMKESYLLDVAVVYALISFLAVVALVNIYFTVYNRKKAEQEKKEAEG